MNLSWNQGLESSFTKRLWSLRQTTDQLATCKEGVTSGEDLAESSHLLQRLFDIESQLSALKAPEPLPIPEQ